MELTTLKQHIKTGKTDSFYIFSGEEWKVQEIYINEMSKLYDRKIYLNSVDDALPSLKSRSFFKQKTLYVVRDDKELMTTESLQQNLKELLAENTLILLVSSVDKRTKFYKTYSNSFIEFSTLERSVLKRYVRKEIALSDKNIELLMTVCENNYGRILLEIDKIRKYKEYLNADSYEHDSNNSLPATYADSVFEHLIKDGTIYEPPYDAVFDFVDEVLKCHVNTAFDLLNQCYEMNEATLVMLSVLYNSTKQVLQVQACDSSDIANTTGLSTWQIKKAKEKLNYRSIGDLVYMLKLIRQTERDIKTGNIEEQYAMQYVLVNVM